MHSALTENKIMKNEEKMMVFDLIEKLIEKGETISISAFGFLRREKSGYAVVRLNTGQTAYGDTLADSLKQLCIAVGIPVSESDELQLAVAPFVCSCGNSKYLDTFLTFGWEWDMKTGFHESDEVWIRQGSSKPETGDIGTCLDCGKTYRLTVDK